MGVPAELKRLPQWVCWKLETREGKATKVPYRADGQGLAKTTDPATWSPLAPAWRVWQSDGMNGVGFVVTAGDPYVGIDLDKVRDPLSGELSAEAQTLVELFRSYTEVTPSETGIRIWIKGKIPGSRSRKGSIELYDHERYFTVTGRKLEGSPETIEERQAQLEQLYQSLFPPTTNEAQPKSTSAQLSDLEVLDLARKASNGSKVEALLAGDAKAYGSPSEADQALISLLAFYTQDPGQLERIWRGSRLWRDKAEREDYRRRTIDKALSGLGETYSPHDAGGEIRQSAAPALPGAESATSATDDEPWLTPLGDLLSKPEEQLDWLVDGLLVRGGVGVFGAKPKVGKTTLLTQLALAVARGQKFLGRPTKRGLVVYLALEEDRGRVVARFRALGAHQADEVHLHVGIPGADGLQKLAAAIASLQPVLAIVDPIQRLTRLENINDYSEVSNATDPIIQLARGSGCAIVFSHHLSKNDRESGDQLLGSTALFGTVDTSVIIRKAEDGVRTLETIQRYGASQEPVVLGHDDVTGAAWMAGAVEDYERERDQLQLLKLIAEQVDPPTQTDLLNASGIRWDRVARALAALVEKRLVEKVGEGRRGDPYRYHALRRPEEVPTTYLNSNPVSLPRNDPRQGNGQGNGQGNEIIELPEAAHGFLAPLKGVGQGNLPPSALDALRQASVESPPPLPVTPATVLRLPDTRRIPCPDCGGLPYTDGPAGPPQRRCHGCGHVWTPAPPGGNA